ncbi:hypothetical protein [Cupriavidus taiwanensis]|uniref:Uncharacterized protein n=1 Tax=Cupriavidus taiwanensis TaxID=164546 RepID=A0A7Z7NMY4_9BURK|nr:hypothetical protein [Cupriavidus taiwanensis]SOZ08747.1 conserved hypothetical protein [Cupriavidus taiwanensis]SOZ11084.1 conserved hypothetical protein [Cupriavidus taiwanensis]SOZ42434.1 conserved hypothetical protein [Cupriavidus taiwanensis]SPC21446.1 conserved hypothetical protein [Cupriavidus taiwanensis]SPD55585.1 conserved protein of unknown function [Cupriavidus taiwanensis]
MPEQLTKHPDVTLQVLRSAGARCGEGETQAILRSCPPARFCKLPGGEVCVYGLDGARAMTQFTAADWQSLAPLGRGGAEHAAAGPWNGMAVGIFVAGVAAGALAAAVLARWRRSHRRR